ncbi:MAG: PH domain-containing protein [Deltaproteobacteria bacterium]|nr:PH domain-containing protein [Deltaproteobacteria bacterium]
MIIFIPLFYLCIESSNRKIFVDAKGIRIKKLFREKLLRWEDITNLDTMIIRSKVYLLLTTTRGFHILTNTYEKFTTLVRDIIDHMDERKVEPAVPEIIGKSVVRKADILTAWIAVAILVTVIVLKLACGG